MLELVPHDAIGMIKYGPIETANEEIKLLSEFSGFSQIKKLFIADLSKNLQNRSLRGLNRKGTLAYIMLDPNEFDNPYAILVPITGYNTFRRSCKFKSKLRTVTPTISAATSVGGGEIYIGNVGKYAVMAGNENVCRKILDLGSQSRTSLAAFITPADQAILDSGNISCYFNLSHITEMFDNNLEGAKFELLDMIDSTVKTPAAKDISEASRVQIECLFAALKDSDTLCCALSVSEDGMLLRANIRAIEGSLLATLFSGLSAPAKIDYLGLTPSGAFFVSTWEADPASIRAYAKALGKNNDPRIRAAWNKAADKFLARTPNGMFAVIQGETGSLGPVRFPGVIYITDLTESQKNDWEAKILKFTQEMLGANGEIKKGIKKVRGVALKSMKIPTVLATVEVVYGSVAKNFILTANVSGSDLLVLVSALKNAKKPGASEAWKKLREKMAIKPKILTAISIQTIMRMVIAGIKTPKAGSSVSDKVAVSLPGLVMGIEFTKETAKAACWVSKQELIGIKNIWNVLGGGQPEPGPNETMPMDMPMDMPMEDMGEVP